MKQVLGVSAIAAIVALTGCTQPPVKKAKWVYSHSMTEKQERAAQLAALRAQGVQVFVQGESVRIVLPDSDVFVTNSANLLDEARATLTKVSKLIKTYTIVRINVNAYSDSQAWAGAPVDRKLALTNAQAQTVASYLWQSGIDSRFMVAKGFSSHDAVAWNGTPAGRHFNRRVEINFRFYPHLETYN